MREDRVRESSAELASEMLAAGVAIAIFEARFEHAGGRLGDDVHAEWETAVEKWWELAARFDSLSRSGQAQSCVGHAASIARMVSLPLACVP